MRALTNPTTWTDALAVYQQHLALVEKWVDGGGEAPASFAIPHSLGAMPETMAEYAAGLLKRGRDLEDRLSSLQEQRSGIVLGRMTKARVAPCYLDRSA